MNRLFLLMMLLGCSLLSLSAQKITVDRIEKDGRHQVATKLKDFWIGGKNYSIGLKVFESSNDEEWQLVISSYEYLPDSAEVLLKLGNYEVIHLSAKSAFINKVTKPGREVSYGNKSEIEPPKTINHYFTFYEFDKTVMDKVDAYGIIKIRISNGAEFRDKVYMPKNKLGKYLMKCRKKIKQRIESPVKPQSLFDDF